MTPRNPVYELMTFKLPAAHAYDEESFPNLYTFAAVDLYSDQWFEFEISWWRDDRAALFVYADWCRRNGVFFVGFNSLHYDYPLLHFILEDIERATVENIYQKSQEILHGNERSEIWENKRFIQQIDLFKIHHFDNKAKTTSLKALEVNMRSEDVLESEIPFGTVLTQDQVPIIKYYNRVDTAETKRFAHISMPDIELRWKMREIMSGDVLNFNDTKLGKELLAQRLGDDLCYTRDSNGKRQPRQTFRHGIPLAQCILPYIQFGETDFRRIHHWLYQQTIYETKGAFTDLKALVNGIEYVFGTGGLHGSVKSRVYVSDSEWAILDDDVASLYPSVAIVNRFAPEHLGAPFIEHYANLKAERFKHKKGTPLNKTLKLALNGVYGDSNSPYSVFYDPKFTMSITINGQLILAMFVEWLLTIPTLEVIQANTDGVTYRVDRSLIPRVEEIRAAWQHFTRLDLEQVEYSRVWIRDVNNYVAETPDGKVKLKGAYWTPDKHPEDIQNLSPTGWYRDYSADICAKAAVACMTKGADIASFIYSHVDMFDFMLREKCKRTDKLLIDGVEQQRVLRYFMSRDGGILQKVAPPTEPERMGQFKPARGVSDYDYNEWHRINGNVHNPALHTKNRSVYENRTTHFHAGYFVTECNHVKRFNFATLDYSWYIAEAEKLVIR